MDERQTPIQELLFAWGALRAVSSAYDIDYPHAANFARQIRNPGGATVQIRPVPESELAAVERAIGELKRRCESVPNDLRYESVTRCYLRQESKDRRLTEAEVAKDLGVSKSTVRNARIAAENWIDGRITP